jgi:hypothetical protein
LQQAIDAAVWPGDVLPLGKESGEALSWNGFNASLDQCQACSANLSQHVGFTPLDAGALGSEGAAHDAPCSGKTFQRSLDDRWTHAQLCRRLCSLERAMSSGEPADEIANGVGNRREHCASDAGRHRYTDRVAQSAKVFDGSPALTAWQPNFGCSSLGRQRCRPPRVGAAAHEVFVGQWTEYSQGVGDSLEVAESTLRRQPLHAGRNLGDRVGVEQLAKLSLAEQLGEQPGVDGQCGGTPFCQRRIALVQERTDVAEEQRAGER